MLVPDIAFTLKDYVLGPPEEEASILLSDLTTGVVGTREWIVYIDGVAQTAVADKDIVVTYTSGLEYAVKLTVTDSDGAYVVGKVFLILDGEHWSIFQTIFDLVRYALGDGVNWAYANVIKVKYQDLLLPAVESYFTQLEIEDGVDVSHDERFWPHLANLLISYLIIRDLITVNLNKSMAGSAGGGTGGEVTKILTGPTEVRFNAPSGTLAAAFKEGFYSLIQDQLCGLSSRLGVLISGCSEPIMAPRKLDVGYTGYAVWTIVPTSPVSTG